MTEILGAPQRETVKEKQIKCVLAPRRGRHHPARDGSIDLAEDPSVPEDKPKSALAPIRRPPSRAEGHCTGARLAPFSLPPGAAHSLFVKNKKRMGGASPVKTAPCGSRIPRAVDNRPYGVSGSPSGPAAVRRPLEGYPSGKKKKGGFRLPSLISPPEYRYQRSPWRWRQDPPNPAARWG